jgi:pimeloyl-ACP methyl ester carboxylesterase
MRSDCGSRISRATAWAAGSRCALDFPDALASLILIDNAGVAGANESDLQKQAANEDYNPLVLAGIEDADRLVAMVVHKPPFVPSRLKPVLYADALKYRDQLDTAFWVIATEMRDRPLNDRLGEVTVPTLIIWGRHDRLIDVSCVAVLEAGIANSRAHVLDHVGHVPMVEDPKATAALMKDFLAGL